MQIHRNIKTYSVTWLSNTYDPKQSHGIVENYYIPDSIVELKDLCTSLYRKNEPFRVVGHTSNIYFLPNTNVKHLITTKNVKCWVEYADYIYCDCGANVRQIVREMVKRGVEGFSMMCDMPGTVASALYGNSGVSEHSISSLLLSAKVLKPNGEIVEMSKEQLCFSYRSSLLKNGEMKGIILSCKLRKKYGKKEKIHLEAYNAHKWRLANHPGLSSNNLGSTVILDNGYTLIGVFLRSLAWVVSRVIYHTNMHSFTKSFILKMLGEKELDKYLFGWNRYVWVDSNAHKSFEKYIHVLKLLYKNPRFEIEIL